MSKVNRCRFPKLLLLAAISVLGTWYSPLLAHHSPPTAQSPPASQQQQLDLTAVEKEMADHPLESFALARRAGERMADRPERIKQLFATAARLQEESLPLLNESQVEELAEVTSKALGAPKAAQEIRRRWLAIREKALGPADGPGRLKLAQFYHKWLDDRDEAARLCQEAFHVAPDLTAAARMLREVLGYQMTEVGWQPRKEKAIDSPGHRMEKIKSGATTSEVLQVLQKPSRVARQILYRRYREQWFYDDSPGSWIEFDCFKGHDPRVLAIRTLQPVAR
jgi:hypothetical protein